MSRRRARAKARLRRKLLGWLLPDQRPKLNVPGYTPLVVVVPMPKGTLSPDQSREDRAQACAYAGEAARLMASQATRARVGSSARAPRSPEEQFATVAVEQPFEFKLSALA